MKGERENEMGAREGRGREQFPINLHGPRRPFHIQILITPRQTSVCGKAGLFSRSGKGEARVSF